MIDLEIPKKLRPLVAQARTVGANVLRPISRKYDTQEHAYPKELDLLAALLDGLNAAGSGASAASLARGSDDGDRRVKNGGNMATVLGMIELAWGDLGLALSLPRQGLGNAAIAAVATDEQKTAFGKKWIAMAITEPDAGSDSAAIRTTARREGDEWVLNGEKIFVTAGSRAEAVVVWATLDASLGRAAIKSFLVPKDAPGIRVARLEKKLGIRASDTATLVLEDCRIPAGNILGSPELAGRDSLPPGSAAEWRRGSIDTRASFAGVMKTFDNTRPVVAAMAIGVARAALERTRELVRSHPDLDRLEAELEAARLLTLHAAWMADNRIPNSLEASMAKAKAGRVATELTLRCVELAGAIGYGEGELLEKWARDAKICDIFEGTQQIQMLIVARRLLDKTSSELR